MKLEYAKKYEIMINKFQLGSYCLHCLKENILLIDKINTNLYRVILRLDSAGITLLKQALDAEHFPDRIKELED